MAHQEHDREDLLKEGTHLIRRGRLRLRRPGVPNAVDHRDIDHREYVVGFRASGAGSLYVNADPVFQFNPEGHLRRLYGNGERFAAENGRLCRLKRQPNTVGRLSLTRQPLRPDELQYWIDRWVSERAELTRWLTEAVPLEIDTVGVSEAEFRRETLRWLDQISVAWKVARGPEQAGNAE